MYKCSECGTEYQTAPKYCECGNDIFINIEDEVDEFVPQEIDDDIDQESVRTSKYHGDRRNFRKNSSSPVGLSVFVICIILSFLVLFVIANPKKDSAKIQSDTQITEEKIEIPSADTYWDDTPVKIVQKEEPKEQKTENILDKIVQQIVPQEQPQKEVKPVATAVKTPVATPKKTVQSQAKPQQVKTTQKPQTQTQKQTASKTTQKTASNNTQSQTGMTFGDLTNKIRNQYPAQSTTSTQTQPKQTTQTQTTKQTAPIPQTSAPTKTTTTTQTPVTTTPKTPQTQTTQTQVQQQTHTATVSVVQQKSQAQLRQELATYKSGLRNAIGRKIDFTRVIGDGDCTLSFRINSNGRLTSKAFTKQSSNITLNDAVFNALNTMTSYNPPPDGYNGETLRLNIKFYNGNFEISLN